MNSSSNEKRPLLTAASSSVIHVQSSRLWRNACVLNLSTVLTGSGFIALGSIQSSLNSDEGLGVTQMAVGSAFALFGALLSGVVIRLLGCKWTLLWSQLLSSLCLLANFYPTWGTFIPAAIISGLVNGFMVVTQRVYTAQLGHLHSDATFANSFIEQDENSNVPKKTSNRSRTQGRFFLLFVASYKLAYLVGNLSSSIILGSGSSELPTTLSPAASLVSLWSNRSEEVVQQCGAGYCNEDLFSGFYDVMDRSRIYILIGFCLGMSLLSIAIVTILLDDLDKLAARDCMVTVLPMSPPSSLASLWVTFKSTIALHRNPRLLLMVPTALSLMAIDSFWMADFSKAFITCALGMEFIGYVMMWMGVSATLASVVFGWMSSRLLRLGPLIVAPLLQIALVIGLLYWVPDENSLFALCAYTASWCLAAGVRHSLLSALVGIVFRDDLELAFSNILMWGASGSVMVFAWSNWLCMDVKLYLIIAMLGIGLVFYVFLEVLLEVDRRRSKCNEQNIEPS